MQPQQIQNPILQVPYNNAIVVDNEFYKVELSDANSYDTRTGKKNSANYNASYLPSEMPNLIGNATNIGKEIISIKEIPLKELYKFDITNATKEMVGKTILQLKSKKTEKE